MTKTKTEFLFGDGLIDRLKIVARGNDVRIATAFWSAEGIIELFGSDDIRDARILCDIAMGSTSPRALKMLGAPDNDSLRHHERLHAKVVISDRGLVVGSANISNRALRGGNSQLWQLEAGTLHIAGSAAWNQAVKWFDDLHEQSSVIREPELEWAKIAYVPPKGGGGTRRPRSGSLLDIVATTPERFARISFVVTGEKSTEKQVMKARSKANKLETSFAKSEIDVWPNSGIFTGWDKDQVEANWQNTFVEFWLGPRTVTVQGYKGSIFDPDNGSVLARPDWRNVQRIAGVALPARKVIGAADAALARLLVSPGEGALFSDGAELAERVAELMQ